VKPAFPVKEIFFKAISAYEVNHLCNLIGTLTAVYFMVELHEDGRLEECLAIGARTFPVQVSMIIAAKIFDYSH